MKQDFVYHTLSRPERRPRRARSAAVAVPATEAVIEYFAYIGALSIAVVIAIITFTYAANVTVKWLDAVSKPGFFDSQTLTSTAPKAPDVQFRERASFAMLPAPEPQTRSRTASLVSR